MDRGVGDIGAIDDGHGATALHFNHILGADESGRVLVETDADRERVVGDRGEQTAEAIALAEMLIDDEPVGQAQAWSQTHTARDGRGSLVPVSDHVLAEDAGPGARSTDRDAMGVAGADQPGYRGAPEKGRDAQLIAPGEENAGGLLQALQAAALLTVPAGIEVHDRHPVRADVGKQLLVPR